MKNATLIINDSKGFGNDIWQDDTSDFDRIKWKLSIKYLKENLIKLYRDLDISEEFGGGNELTYSLGDVINLLDNIDIKIKEEN